MVFGRRREKGFTLVELVVVCAIIAILASLALIALSRFRITAIDAVTKAEIKEFHKAQLMHEMDHNSFLGNNGDKFGDHLDALSSLSFYAVKPGIWMEVIQEDPFIIAAHNVKSPNNVYEFDFSTQVITRR